MSLTTRRRILANIHKQLEGISKTSGYNFTPASVRRLPGNLENQTQWPVIVIDEGVEEYDGSEITVYKQLIKRRLRVKIHGLVEYDDRGENALMMLADIEKAITTDADAGETAIEISLVSNQVRVAQERQDVHSVEVELNVFYKAEREEPRECSFGFALDLRHTEKAFQGNGASALPAIPQRADIVMTYGETFGGTSDNKITAILTGPTINDRDWTRPDWSADKARAAGALFWFHPIHWTDDDYYPTALGYPIADRAQRRAANLAWTTEVCNRYGSRLDIIDVWNECIDNQGNGLKQAQTGGIDEILLVEIGENFDKAKELCPDALLVLNDFGCEVAGAKADEFLSTLIYLRENHCEPAAGFQCHLSIADRYTQTQLYDNWKRFRDADFECVVSELDFRTDEFAGTAEERDAEVAAYAYDVGFVIGKLKFKHARTWGTDHKVSWLQNRYQVAFPDQRPLLFGEDLTPTTAFARFMEGLAAGQSA